MYMHMHVHVHTHMHMRVHQFGRAEAVQQPARNALVHVHAVRGLGVVLHQLKEHLALGPARLARPARPARLARSAAAAQIVAAAAVARRCREGQVVGQVVEHVRDDVQPLHALAVQADREVEGWLARLGRPRVVHHPLASSRQ